MSRLDEILDSIKPFDPNAHTQPTTKAEGKQQIKDLFNELIDNTMLYSGGLPDASINLEQIRQKVSEL